MVATLDCYLFNARKVRKVVISEKRPKALNNTFIATHGVFYSQCSGPWLYAIGPDVSTYSKTVKTKRQKKVANFADAFTLMCSLGLEGRQNWESHRIRTHDDGYFPNSLRPTSYLGSA